MSPPQNTATLRELQSALHSSAAASWLASLPVGHGGVLPSFPNTPTALCHVPLPFYWTISTKEIHISGTPASFILIWLWGHIVSWPHVMSTLGRLPSLTLRPPTPGWITSPGSATHTRRSGFCSFPGIKPSQGCFSVCLSLLMKEKQKREKNTSFLKSLVVFLRGNWPCLLIYILKY